MSLSEKITKELFSHYTAERSQCGKTLRHGAWMMDNLPHGTDEKRGRWIGYAQAILVFHGVITLDELRERTRG